MMKLRLLILLFFICGAALGEPVAEAQLESLDKTQQTSKTSQTTTQPILRPDQTPDSVFIQRLQQLPYVVELPYNPVIKQYIIRYMKSPKHLADLLAKHNYYMPIFQDVLAQYDLPYELAYLPIIESRLNPNARSHMGAVGLWQFMPSTGKKYGLEINSLVDERRDPVKSTHAAAKFMKALYKIFKDWNLVIAAYNCGPGNVNKAIYRAEGKRDFWSIYPFLPEETRVYLPLYIAAVYTVNYADCHGVVAKDGTIFCEDKTPADSVLFEDLKQTALNELVKNYPNMQEVHSYLMSQIELSKFKIHGELTFTPILLIGNAGCGKTSYALELIKILQGKPGIKIDLGNSVANFTCTGSDPSYKDAKNGLIIESMFAGNDINL
jgi:hypothetical protein